MKASGVEDQHVGDDDKGDAVEGAMGETSVRAQISIKEQVVESGCCGKRRAVKKGVEVLH